MDNESEPDGSIIVKLCRITHGGREGEEAHWKLEMMEKFNDYWKVKATCIDSEMRRFQVGDEIEFELDKSISIWDLDTELEHALREYDY